jgi:hypothetical protein
MMVPEESWTTIMIAPTTSRFCAGQFFFVDRTILTPFLLCWFFVGHNNPYLSLGALPCLNPDGAHDAA